MKNKRWKREAKRIKGECSNHIYCSQCKVCDICHEYILSIPHTPFTPGDMEIRKLEMICKGVK